MADFRKLLLALIAGALLFGTVASAADFNCQVAGVPTLVRTEGVADYVGDVLMLCSGTLPPSTVSSGLVANIRLNFQPLTVTSKDLDTRTNPGPTSEATLILDNAIWPDGSPHVKGYASTTTNGVLTPFADGSQNIYQAVRINNNELEWQGVVLVGPGSNATAGTFTRSIRMTNVRINAAGLGPNVPITTQVNITSPTSIPIFGNVSVLVANTRVGTISTHVPFTAKNCDLPAIPQGSFVFTSTFVEGFGTAFKPRYNDYPGAVPHWIPGGGYFDESGYNPVGFATAGTIPGGVLDVNSSLVGLSAIGNATQGTQLGLTITSIPTGLTISAPATITTTNGLYLERLSMSPTSGTGPTVTVTYEVKGYVSPGTAQFLVDSVAVPVTATYLVPPVVGTASAHGRYLPNATVFTAVTETVAPVPRFVDSVAPNSVDGPVITITQNCKTLLLFPYITSSAGYNTGIAISNTSVDPYGEAIVTGQIGYPSPFVPTLPQVGACTLWFYGQSNLTALTAAQHAQTTISIPAGGQFITNLAVGAKGFVYGRDGSKTAACDTAVSGNTCPDMPAYAGYMIATCNFQWGHGFSFVTDTGSDRTMGYLALVIPDRGSAGRLPQDSSFGAAANQGEQLGQ